VDDPNHPIMAGLPKSFRIKDELYYVTKEASGSGMKILATAHDLANGKEFPSVWITDLPNTRIVCIALGHDGQAHDLPEFRKLLQNATEWAAGKK
jgi:type 1 glutamine amidotransferase